MIYFFFKSPKNHYPKGKTLQFILFPFLFQINRSKDKGVKRLILADK